jgi:hypothetical protein
MVLVYFDMSSVFLNGKKRNAHVVGILELVDCKKRCVE